jgi:glyceraldehyde 3-phosphate dehydrogenase
MFPLKMGENQVRRIQRRNRMSTKVAINGFGRIGRNVVRAALKKGTDLEIVAVNDLTDTKTLAHLFKYDSIYGPLEQEISHDVDSIMVGDWDFKVFSERDPAKVPWGEVGADIVIEGTGFFRAKSAASKHLRDGVKKVILTAPGGKGDEAPDATIALGVNEETYKADEHNIVSNASCTTNCLAPVAKVLDQEFGIVKGLMTTIHSYTNGQKILDLPHKDLRRARAAALSMIPTSTGAAVAVALVLPQLQGKLDGIAVRVPTATVSLVDLVATVEKDVTVDALKDAFRSAANGPLKGILQYTDEELVSVDFSGNPHSSIVDGPFIRTMGDRMVKVLSWYDNEWGYSNRVLDLAEFIAKDL